MNVVPCVVLENETDGFVLLVNAGGVAPKVTGTISTNVSTGFQLNEESV